MNAFSMLWLGNVAAARCCLGHGHCVVVALLRVVLSQLMLGVACVGEGVLTDNCTCCWQLVCRNHRNLCHWPQRDACCWHSMDSAVARAAGWQLMHPQQLPMHVNKA